MSDKDDPARDDRKSPVRLPGLVVWEEERTGVEKVLARIRRLLGGGAVEPEAAEGEASGGRAPARAPIDPMPLPGDGRAGGAPPYAEEGPERADGRDESGAVAPVDERAQAGPEEADPSVAEADEGSEESGGEEGGEIGAGPDGGPSASPVREREPLQRATLQMLPGRLEPVNPRIVRQELRFLRAPGSEQEVTVGSATADPPGHVTIDHASVQPVHARMRFEDGGWTIESLADVDPVRLNREPIEPESGAHPLADGDTVRFGRAEFVFRIG